MAYLGTILQSCMQNSTYLLMLCTIFETKSMEPCSSATEYKCIVAVLPNKRECTLKATGAEVNEFDSGFSPDLKDNILWFYVTMDYFHSGEEVERVEDLDGKDSDEFFVEALEIVGMHKLKEVGI